MKNDYMISIVVPVYNEEKMIAPFIERTEAVISAVGCEYEIIFALDPCSDNTYGTIKDLMKTHPNVKLLTFSRRFGQPASTLGGIFHSKGDACVVIDVDLQDPPELIPQMIEKWQEGYDVVYAQRAGREGETWLKKLIAATGYRVINKISSVDIPVDTGDYRLISRKVIDELQKLNEHHGFLKGMVPFVGFKQTPVKYHREARFEGEGKYNRFFGSTRIGFNGIFCYSTKPLEYITYLGVILTGGAFTGLILYIVISLAKGNDLASLGNWLNAFWAGLIILCIGITGEYISRTYEEVTGRPLYIVDEFDENTPDRS